MMKLKTLAFLFFVPMLAFAQHRETLVKLTPFFTDSSGGQYYRFKELGILGTVRPIQDDISKMENPDTTVKFPNFPLLVDTTPHKRPKYNWRRPIAASVFTLIAGGSNGVNQAINKNWNQVHAKHPNLDSTYWNPAISYLNKYVDHDETKHKTPLVWFTDGDHLTNSLTQTSQYAAGFAAGGTIVYSIGKNKGKDKRDRPPIWHYFLDVAINFGTYTIGNFVTYDLYMK